MAVFIDLQHEHRHLADVSHLQVQIVVLKVEDLEVVIDRVADDRFPLCDLLDDRLDVTESRCMLEVLCLDAGDPLAIVDHIWLFAMVAAGLNQGVENNIAVEIDDADTGQSLALLGENALAVESENLRLLTALVALVEHVEEHDGALLSDRTDAETFDQVPLGEPVDVAGTITLFLRLLGLRLRLLLQAVDDGAL